MGRYVAASSFSMNWKDFDIRGVNTLDTLVDVALANGFELQAAAKECIAMETPFESGRMQDTVDVWNFTISPWGISMMAGWRTTTFGLGYKDFYPKYVLHGTGLWGPHKTRIIPKVKKVLAWEDQKTGENWVAKSVKGQPPQPILRNARDRFIEFANVYLAECLVEAHKALKIKCRKGNAKKRITSKSIKTSMHTTKRRSRLR